MYPTDYVNNKFISLFLFCQLYIYFCGIMYPLTFSVSIVNKALLDVNYLPFVVASFDYFLQLCVAYCHVCS